MVAPSSDFTRNTFHKNFQQLLKNKHYGINPGYRQATLTAATATVLIQSITVCLILRIHARPKAPPE
jgi:hypothetical protein